MKILHVNLIKSILYRKNGKNIIIPINSIVMLDLKRNVGYWNGDHFDIFRDEYLMSS